MKILKDTLLCAAFAAAGFAGLGADDSRREFRYGDGKTVYPSYRTWEFSVEEPGLYVIDIGSDDGKAAPGARKRENAPVAGDAALGGEPRLAQDRVNILL